jgi:hypothetical protein
MKKEIKMKMMKKIKKIKINLKKIILKKTKKKKINQ